MKPVLKPSAVVELVPDRATLSISGIVGSMVPDTTLRAIREAFDNHGSPAGLTLIFPVAAGDVYDCPGIDHLAAEGLISAVVGGSFVYGRGPRTDHEPELTRLITEGRIRAYNFSIGTMFTALREAGARRPGVVTKVGLGTFQDPRFGGGRLNDATPADFVDLVTLGGEEFLNYRLPPVDVALLRATKADSAGNLVATREVSAGGLLAHAMAARANGGRVVVQVEEIVDVGSLDPRGVLVPGNLVDALVLVSGEQQATQVSYDPTLSNEERLPGTPMAPAHDGAERIILPRAARLLRPDDLVILGFGMPSHLPGLDEIPEGVRFTVEHGAVGGYPASGLQFGGSRNAEALLPTPSMFDIINGGGCDTACLGFAEVDATGAVNVSRLPAGIPGSGGFTDITTSTSRLLFCGSFTAGGVEVEEQPDGEIRIIKEGRFKKFVENPRERTYVPGGLPDQEVFFVTDRCILSRRSGKLTVEEIYPGIDFESHIQAHCEFPLMRADGR